MGLSQARQKKAGAGYIDIIGDIVESANLVIRRPRTASVVLGGWHAEEFHQPGHRAGRVLQRRSQRSPLRAADRHRHTALRRRVRVEPRGSAELGQAGHDSARVSVQADATIALPILASALATTAPPLLAGRHKPVFTLAGRVMTVDGQTVPNERFEVVNEPAV